MLFVLLLVEMTNLGDVTNIHKIHFKAPQGVCWMIDQKSEQEWPIA